MIEATEINRRMKAALEEEGRRRKEEIGKREEGRGKKEEGRRKRRSLDEEQEK